MDLLKAISVTTNTADTIFNIATFDWDKKSLGKLAITTSALVGFFAVITCIETTRISNSTATTKTRKRKRNRI